MMDKHICSPVVLCDEAVALLRVEPLHRALSHLNVPSGHLRSARCEPVAARPSRPGAVRRPGKAKAPAVNIPRALKNVREMQTCNRFDRNTFDPQLLANVGALRRGLAVTLCSRTATGRVTVSRVRDVSEATAVFWTLVRLSAGPLGRPSAAVGLQAPRSGTTRAPTSAQRHRTTV